MVSIKQSIRVIRSVFVGCALGALLFCCGKIFYWLDEDTCLDVGNVWDGNEKRCRDDCWKWSKEFGCIQMTNEQVAIFKKCRHSAAYCVPHSVYLDMCMSNRKAWNVEAQECDFEFKLKDCNKLSGNWKYPATCEKK